MVNFRAVEHKPLWKIIDQKRGTAAFLKFENWIPNSSNLNVMVMHDYGMCVCNVSMPDSISTSICKLVMAWV